MWNHYSTNHESVCFEVNLSSLLIKRYNGSSIECMDVNYVEELDYVKKLLKINPRNEILNFPYALQTKRKE